MSTEGTGAAGATGTVVPGTTTTPTTSAGAVVPGEEFKGMSAAQFTERLAAERASGAKGVLKDLGVEKLEDAKARLDAEKKRTDAELTAAQRHEARVKELEPKAANAERYETAIKTHLEAREKAVPADKKALLELAPPVTDPVARLEWITKAEQQGLFSTAQTQQLATTKAVGTSPPASKGTLPKSLSAMTPAERAQHKAELEAKHRAGQT